MGVNFQLFFFFLVCVIAYLNWNAMHKLNQRKGVSQKILLRFVIWLCVRYSTFAGLGGTTGRAYRRVSWGVSWKCTLLYPQPWMGRDMSIILWKVSKRRVGDFMIHVNTFYLEKRPQRVVAVYKVWRKIDICVVEYAVTQVFCSSDMMPLIA